MWMPKLQKAESSLFIVWTFLMATVCRRFRFQPNIINPSTTEMSRTGQQLVLALHLHRALASLIVPWMKDEAKHE
ncbi:hypothetical protein K1719_003740 [Acacia pycnantha]|nr:hypothetical protein K1719_003740 [Acacia pycnantha]